ncbi:MAG: terminase small subunit [Chloroflexi bacterium]|nr:terminase small subunit [Chloroflexota bacterium]
MAEPEIEVKKGGGDYSYKPSKGGKLFNAKEMAMVAGVSEVAFNNHWIKNGCPFIPDPMKPKNKLYASAAVMKWRLVKDMVALEKRMVGEVVTRHDAMTSGEADRRKKQAEALLAELKLSKELELVANIEDLMNNFANAVGHVTASLLGWRANLTGLLTMQPEDVIDKVLDEEITRVLSALKEYNHEYEGEETEEL